MEQKIINIIKKATNVDDSVVLNLDTPLNDMHINSLNFLKIVVDIEEEFDIEFDDEELNLEMFESVASVVEKVKEKL